MIDARNTIAKCMFACVLVVTGSQGSVLATDVVVVCPTDFTASLQPWVKHRRKEGMAVAVIPSSTDAKTLRDNIRDAATEQTRYVLLIGDAPVVGTPCRARTKTPILYAPTKVTAQWGSTPTLSSDMMFGDFDRDSIPDAVVGRLPVDEPQQLDRWIQRIIARESSDDFGPWRSQVQLVGGVGGFGKMADAAIESVTRTIVTSVLPTDCKTSVCYASPGHPFYPEDVPFTDAVVDRYCQGARFWVYAGHGQVTHLDRVPSSVTGTPVLDQRSVQRLHRPASGSPIAIMLSCYTGALDAAEDSIAEEMVLTEGGPIAIVAGSRVTMPYGNTTAALGLIDGVFRQKLPRLGDAWLSALTEMQKEEPSDKSATRVMVDALATVVSPAGTNLTDERREHMLLYNLIGDPTLRLQHPQEIEIGVATGHDFGEAIEVQLTSPIDGELVLSFDRPLGGVDEGDPNQTTVASISTQVQAGQSVSPTMLLPKEVRGPIVVRALVSGAGSWASAAARTIVR
ncbi:MAG: C25 family cysteine peptidase [Rubripirellula sp.]